MRKLSGTTRKAFVGMAGALVVLVGIALVPLPGPGWFVVFLGLTILGAEFDWAKRLHDWAKALYRDWRSWIRVQPWLIQAMFGLFTLIFLLVIFWLINTLGFINWLFNLGLDWLNSPFVGLVG